MTPSASATTSAAAPLSDIDREVETKGYVNVSRHFRSLLREAQAKDADACLQALLIEGLVSGKEIPLIPDFWRQLKSDAGKILASQTKSKAVRKPRR